MQHTPLMLLAVNGNHPSSRGPDHISHEFAITIITIITVIVITVMVTTTPMW